MIWTLIASWSHPSNFVSWQCFFIHFHRPPVVSGGDDVWIPSAVFSSPARPTRKAGTLTLCGLQISLLVQRYLTVEEFNARFFSAPSASSAVKPGGAA